MHKNIKDEELDNVKNEYILVFEEFHNCLKEDKKISSENTQKCVVRLYDIIDKYYGCSNEVLDMFARMYINEAEYIKVLTSYDERLPNYINESIKQYLKGVI